MREKEREGLKTFGRERVDGRVGRLNPYPRQVESYLLCLLVVARIGYVNMSRKVFENNLSLESKNTDTHTLSEEVQ